jgi:hypothetical protein
MFARHIHSAVNDDLSPRCLIDNVSGQTSIRRPSRLAVGSRRGFFKESTSIGAQLLRISHSMYHSFCFLQTPQNVSIQMFPELINIGCTE